MGNRIEFPLNGKIYFKKGIKAFENGEKKKAIKYLDKAFKLTQSPEVNFYYAFVLASYKKYKKALKIMNKIEKSYINNEKQAIFYTEILIKNGKFVEAEHIIQNYQLNLTAREEDLWGKLAETLDKKRKSYNVENNSDKIKLVESLKNISTFPPLIQSKKIKEAKKLDLQDLQKLAPMILVDNQIDEISRRAYLELLIQRRDKEDYSFLWFGQIKNVSPIDLPRFDDIKIVHNIIKILKEKLIKFPDLYHLIETEIMHDLLLLYPFIEEVIKDVDFWIDLYVDHLDFYEHNKKSRKAVTKDELKMKEMIDYLNTLSKRH